MGGAAKPVAQRRPFSKSVANLNGTRNSFRRRNEHALNDINEDHDREADAFDIATAEHEKTLAEEKEVLEGESIPTESQEGQEESHVPWYLQQQAQDHVEESPVSQRQALPELPESSPELFQPLLEHVSVELGMDNLTILDLRQLDPPPALGSNLLMIIGTARSEKHLHVSADRLCRWLRTEYKMDPYADGLLGRNELKLKMKRKAKRARLMSAVGSTSSGDADDGIRTGWVCVNVGRVNGGELPEDRVKLQRAEGMVGFGAHTTGSNIVVQMLTEEKRGELDLERLWTGIMNRARRENEKELENDASGSGDVDSETVTYRP